jgi:hypothetical protein
MPGEIPEEHREVFDAIGHEVTWLHAIWLNYRQLYAEKETVDLLNTAAPAFARINQDALLDGVLLHLSRLTDPPSSGKGRDNLVLDRLKPLAKASGDPKLVAELDSALAKVKTTCSDLREHRNKRIAHLDYNVALETAKLPGFSRQSIGDALKAVRDAMNAINMHFRHGPTMYEAVSMQGDGTSLLACLRDGIRLRRLRRRQHTMSPEEIKLALSQRGPLTEPEDDADEEE